MSNEIGEIIFQHRKERAQTQDQYGQHLGISGPAVFKFEKGYVRPSLDLWLLMAIDAGITERRGVLLWLKTKLPEPFKAYIDSSRGDGVPRPPRAGQSPDYRAVENRAAMREAAAADKTLPKGLRALLADDELWESFKPTGDELNFLRDRIAPLGNGSRVAYGEALRLFREITHSF